MTIENDAVENAEIAGESFAAEDEEEPENAGEPGAEQIDQVQAADIAVNQRAANEPKMPKAYMMARTSN